MALETPVSNDTKTTLVCITGYVCRNDLVNEDTFSYYEKFGDFSREINSGSLKVTGDTVYQWTIYSYIFLPKLSMILARFLCAIYLCYRNILALTWTENFKLFLLTFFSLIITILTLYDPRKNQNKKYISLVKIF